MSDPLILHNDELRVLVLPREGGRVASLQSIRSGLEFLTQSSKPRPFLRPDLLARFQDGPSAGIEECLPSVAPCGPQTRGGAVPDHGDFWQLAWNLENHDSRHAILSASGFSRPLHFRKEVLLDGSTLRLRYHVQNTGSGVTRFLYACHPLFAVEAGDRVILPSEVQELELYYSRGQRLGAARRVHWPVTEDGLCLDIVRGPHAGTAEMFYTARLSDSRCAILRNTTGQRLELRFSLEKLPYLGIWLCYGGWPDDLGYPLQYSVALEPTTAPRNSLQQAEDSGMAASLEPGASETWEIDFTVADTPAAAL